MIKTSEHGNTGNTEMTKITAYNTVGRDSANRVVASFTTELTGRNAMNEGVYRSVIWNKDEVRENMRVNFVMVNGMVRVV